MRQAGVLAAAGIVALETMVDRLAEDHARARRLADGLDEIPGLAARSRHARIPIWCSAPSTRQIPLDAEEVAERLAALGVLVGAVGARRFRLVTHYWIDDAGVEQAAGAFRQVFRADQTLKVFERDIIVKNE